MRGLLIAEHMDATLREELLPPLLAVASGGLLDVVVVVVDAVPNERADASSGPVSVEGNLIARGRHRFGFAEILMSIMSATFIIGWERRWEELRGSAREFSVPSELLISIEGTDRWKNSIGTRCAWKSVMLAKLKRKYEGSLRAELCSLSSYRWTETPCTVHCAVSCPSNVARQ